MNVYVILLSECSLWFLVLADPSAFFWPLNIEILGYSILSPPIFNLSSFPEKIYAVTWFQMAITDNFQIYISNFVSPGVPDSCPTGSLTFPPRYLTRILYLKEILSLPYKPTSPWVFLMIRGKGSDRSNSLLEWSLYRNMVANPPAFLWHSSFSLQGHFGNMYKQGLLDLMQIKSTIPDVGGKFT